MLTKVYGSAVFGVEATTITVEVNIDKGIGYHLVGLPDNAIKESNYRIAAALQNNGYKIPGKKITINMAPADLRKEGSAYDLTLALGIISASGQIMAPLLEKYLIMGELSLDGGLQPIKGALPIAIKALEEGFTGFILPQENAKEAAIVKDLEVYGVQSIKEVIHFFDKGTPLERTVVDTRAEFYKNLEFPEFDFSDVKGQESIKRCMENRGSRGAQYYSDWTSRGREDHAGQTPSIHSATDDLEGGSGNHKDPQCGGKGHEYGVNTPEALQEPTSYDFGCCFGRRGLLSPTGRDLLVA